MTSEELAEAIQTRVSTRCRVVSIDGSAFDSTQFATNKDAVEGELFRRLRPWLVRLFSHEDNTAAGMSADEAADLYIKTATQTEQVTFVHAPGI